MRYDESRNKTDLDCLTLSICPKKSSFSENMNFSKNPYISWAIDPKNFQEIKAVNFSENPKTFKKQKVFKQGYSHISDAI